MTKKFPEGGYDPLRPHSHEPNPEPPSTDPAFVFVAADGGQRLISPDFLEKLPQTSLPDCYIVSTGHGTSGPFEFSGVSLLDFVRSQLPAGSQWSQVEVISADGFGNRVTADELTNPRLPERPIILSHQIDGQSMTRQQGLVRMIVPSETDDALRQVKWIGRIVVRR